MTHMRAREAAALTCSLDSWLSQQLLIKKKLLQFVSMLEKRTDKPPLKQQMKILRSEISDWCMIVLTACL